MEFECFLGNSIIIELKIPQAEFNQNDLHIFKVRFGLPKTLTENKSDSALIGAFNASSPCNRNIVCPEGDNWQIERKAVCLIETPSFRGSGALIMNTSCNTLKPYILTAWHLTNGDNPNNWTFLFGWQSSTCDPNTNTSQSILFNGATLRATYEPTDFSLIELNQVPSTNLNLSFLGWDRSNNLPTSTTGIHHPAGDQMKISSDTDPAVLGNVRTNSNTAWRVLWKSGTSEGGSSGSPLFNQNHWVVGQAFSATQPYSPPCNQQTGGNNYGRFDLSWTGGGTDATRLSNWLDPNNTGAITTNTTSIANIETPPYQIFGADYFCTTSNPYSVTNLPPGATVTWSASPQGIVSLTSNGNSVTATKITDGTFSLIATITGAACPSTISRTLKAGSVWPDMNIYGPTYVSCGQVVTYQTSYIEGAGYQWSYPSSWIYNYGQGTWSITMQIPDYAYESTAGEIRLLTYDACNNTRLSTLYVSSSCGESYYYYSMSPNPATSTVTVYSKETNTKEKTKHETITEVNIYDQQGNLKKHQKFGKVNKATINIADLRTGVYFIEIVDDNYKERQQLSVLR